MSDHRYWFQGLLALPPRNNHKYFWTEYAINGEIANNKLEISRKRIKQQQSWRGNRRELDGFECVLIWWSWGFDSSPGVLGFILDDAPPELKYRFDPEESYVASWDIPIGCDQRCRYTQPANWRIVDVSLIKGGVEPTQAKNGLFQRWFSGMSMCFSSLTWFWITILVQLAWFEVQWSLVYLKKTQPRRTTGQLCFEIPPKHLCAVCLDPNRLAGHESHCSIWAGQSQLQGSLFVCCCWCHNDLWDVDVFCIFFSHWTGLFIRCWYLKL